MKRRTCLCLAALCLLSACRFKRTPTLHGSGTLVTETRAVAAFSKLSIQGTGELLLTQGDQGSLTITSDDNIVAAIESTVRGGTLFLGPRGVKVRPTESLRYVLSVKTLEALHAAGALTIRGEALRTERLQSVLNGACTLSLASLEADTVEITVNGVGTARLDGGAVRTAEVHLNGAGRFEGGAVPIETLTLSTNGAGSAQTWVTGRLNAKINGTGTIRYFGSPVLSQAVNGVGRVEALGPKPARTDPARDGADRPGSQAGVF